MQSGKVRQRTAMPDLSLLRAIVAGFKNGLAICKVPAATINTMAVNTAPEHCIRAANAADRPRLIPLINSAFEIETFLEGHGRMTNSSRP